MKPDEITTEPTDEDRELSGQMVLPMLERLRRVLTRREISLGYLASIIFACIRGALCIVWYRVTRKNVVIRFPFMVYAPVKILGPGSVYIDKECSVFYNCFEGLTIVTLSPETWVSIGKGCDLGGLTVRCRDSVVFGDKVMTASCLVQDVMLVSTCDGTGKVMSMAESINGRRIVIGDHAWLCASSSVLQGAVLRQGTVMSAGSSISGGESKGNDVVIGNPAKRMIPIDKLLRLKGTLHERRHSAAAGQVLSDEMPAAGQAHRHRQKL